MKFVTFLKLLWNLLKTLKYTPTCKLLHFLESVPFILWEIRNTFYLTWKNWMSFWLKKYPPFFLKICTPIKSIFKISESMCQQFYYLKCLHISRLYGYSWRDRGSLYPTSSSNWTYSSNSAPTTDTGSTQNLQSWQFLSLHLHLEHDRV